MNKLLFTMIAMAAFGAVGIVVYKTMEVRGASQLDVTHEVSNDTLVKDSCCSEQSGSCCQESMVTAKAGTCCSEQTEMVATKKTCGCSGCSETEMTVSTAETSKSCEHCQGSETSAATCSGGAECSGQCAGCAAAKTTETKSETVQK